MLLHYIMPISYNQVHLN